MKTAKVQTKRLRYASPARSPARSAAAWSVAFFIVALALVPAAHGQTENDLIGQLIEKRDDADPATVKQLAAKKTRGAMEGLVDLYGKLTTIYMKREVIRALAAFDGVAEAEQKALEQVATVATSTMDEELREAAFDVLSGATHLGRTYLARIVDAPAQDQIREKALKLHAIAATKDDASWYRKLFTNEKLASRLREGAFEALAKTVENVELLKYVHDAHNATISRIALEELQRRKAPAVADLAMETLKQVNALPTDRATAAQILVEAKGAKAADELIDLAHEPATTPELLRETIADLLAGLNDENVNKKLVALVGKGKPHEKRFALLATRNVNDDKLVKKVRQHLDEKDAELRRVAIRVLGDHHDAGSADALEKLLDKSKDPSDSVELLGALTKIKGGDEGWQKKLVAFAGGNDRDLRIAALQALAAGDAKKNLPLLCERLAHEDWSTRLAALHALEQVRDRDSVGAMIQQMQKESGRPLIEFAAVLFRLTGQPFDIDAGNWLNWWRNEGKSAPLITEKELADKIDQRERRRLKQSTKAQFFGVRIESHNVAFVIDTSGSMSEALEHETTDGRPATRSDVIKRELVKCLQALDATAFFNLITFNAAVTKWQDGVQPLTDKTRAQAIDYVNHLGARGGTNIFDALEAAFADPRVDTIFFLTDGEPTSGTITDLQFIREHVARWNETRHVQVNCIAVGGDFPLLEWLARDSGGSYVKFS